MSSYIKRTKQFRQAMRDMPAAAAPAKRVSISTTCRKREAAEAEVRREEDAREAARAWTLDAPARAIREAEELEKQLESERQAKQQDAAVREAIWLRLDRGWGVCDYIDWWSHACAWREARGYVYWTPRCPCDCCNMACSSMSCRRGCYS